MNDPKASKPGKAPKNRLRRWLLRIAVLLAIPIFAYLLFRVVYPVWIEKTLPLDAPRIAFSLDNSLIGQLGITDATYQRVMTSAGGRLIALRPDMAGDSEVDPNAVDRLLDELQIVGVLLTGGGDVDPNVYGGDPNATSRINRLRDDFEIALIHAARRRGLPILGICRGCQILNVAMGGRIRNLRTEDAPESRHLLLAGHPVDLTVDSELAKLLGVTHLDKVISLHGQAAVEPGPAVTIAATGPGNVVEAIESDSNGKPGWVIGIQWHPELRLKDKTQHLLFKTLVDRAKEMQQ